MSRRKPLPQSRVDASRQRGKIESSVLGAVGSYLFPSRTRQLSPPAPKILGTSVPGKIGQGRDQNDFERASARGRFCLGDILHEHACERPVLFGQATAASILDGASAAGAPAPRAGR